MPLTFHHIHLKSRDPEKTADWYVRAFDAKVESSVVRGSGDRFIICKMVDGAVIMISGEKTGETLPEGSAKPRLGLEHFAIETQDFDGDLARLVSLGAPLIEGPVTNPAGMRFAFVRGPDDVRIEVMWFPKK